MIDPARSFGRVAREYELGRPSWPPEAIDAVVQELALEPDASVLGLVGDHLTEPTYVAALETHLYWARLAR